jgi:hypothetical protein
MCNPGLAGAPIYIPGSLQHHTQFFSLGIFLIVFPFSPALDCVCVCTFAVKVLEDV